MNLEQDVCDACITTPSKKFSMMGMAKQYEIRPDLLLAVVIDYMSQLENDKSWNVNTFGSIVVYIHNKENKPFKYIEIKTGNINGELRPVDFIFNEETKNDLIKTIKK